VRAGVSCSLCSLAAWLLAAAHGRSRSPSSCGCASRDVSGRGLVGPARRQRAGDLGRSARRRELRPRRTGGPSAAVHHSFHGAPRGHGLALIAVGGTLLRRPPGARRSRVPSAGRASVAAVAAAELDPRCPCCWCDRSLPRVPRRGLRDPHVRSARRCALHAIVEDRFHAARRSRVTSRTRSCGPRSETSPTSTSSKAWHGSASARWRRCSRCRPTTTTRCSWPSTASASRLVHLPKIAPTSRAASRASAASTRSASSTRPHSYPFFPESLEDTAVEYRGARAVLIVVKNVDPSSGCTNPRSRTTVVTTGAEALMELAATFVDPKTDVPGLSARVTRRPKTDLPHLLQRRFGYPSPVYGREAAFVATHAGVTAYARSSGTTSSKHFQCGCAATSDTGGSPTSTGFSIRRDGQYKLVDSTAHGTVQDVRDEAGIDVLRAMHSISPVAEVPYARPLLGRGSGVEKPRPAVVDRVPQGSRQRPPPAGPRSAVRSGRGSRPRSPPFLAMRVRFLAPVLGRVARVRPGAASARAPRRRGRGAVPRSRVPQTKRKSGPNVTATKARPKNIRAPTTRMSR